MRPCQAALPRPYKFIFRSYFHAERITQARLRAARQPLFRLSAGQKRAGRRAGRRALHACPRKNACAAFISRPCGRKPHLCHLLQDPARERHGRVPHSRAQRPERLAPFPGQGAVRLAAAKFDADLPQCPDLRGQDSLSRLQPQRKGSVQPDVGLPRRGV